MHEQVDAFLAAYNAHDPAGIAAALAPGGTQEDVPLDHLNSTPEEIAAGLGPFFVAVPDAKWTETHRMVAGKSIVLLYTLTGHLEKDLGPLKATGKPVSTPGVFVLKFTEAGIITAKDYWDPSDFIKQVT